LVAKGLEQAEEIARALSTRPISKVVSSPALRCLQTVQPLADELGLSVEIRPGLAEGVDFEQALDLLNSLPDDSAACSHGDVIPEVIRALERRGMDVTGMRDTRKGATWVLERSDGRFVAAHAIAPPGKD
jgi:8-oxo-dGTP diphosphatase